MKKWIWTAFTLACVLLSLTSTQDSMPGTLSFEVEEEIDAGTEVANIKTSANLVGDDYRFKFLSTPAADFVINEETGGITTGSRLDRDTLCPSEADCDVITDVAVQLNDNVSLIKITVTITDKNDNTPTYPESETIFEMKESAQIGNSFIIPFAEDLDGPPNGIQRYELQSTSDKFILEEGNVLKLVLNGELDREMADAYYLQVAAIDGGSPTRTGYLDIRVNVEDSNDNAPVFENRTYYATVQENAPNMTPVITVRARDRDLGINARVSYTFAPSTESTYGNLFGIQNLTGEIYVKGVIDFESTSEYRLTVVARDGGQDPVPVDATVVITVIDVNDHTPVIKVNTLSDSDTSTAYIAENRPEGSFVAQVKVSDEDTGRSGEVECSLNENTFSLEQNDQFDNEYQIITAMPLDRERQQQYSLAIICQDKADNPMIEIKHIQIVVADINDNSPIFSPNVYSVEFYENNNIGFSVATVNATDKDEGVNGEIYYSIADDIADTYFQINPSTGRITAKVSIDRETVSGFSFKVEARDKAVNPRNATANVFVTIKDINDEPPKFGSNLLDFYVFENQQIGTEVDAVTAIDYDEPPANLVTYAFLPTPDGGESNFYLHPQSGLITTATVLDREQQSEYVVLVSAHDSGNPPISSTATITIHISDKNDEKPKFIFPNSVNNSAYISNMASVGSVVTRVEASDADANENADLSFYIDNGNEDNTFSIDPTSGLIMLNKNLRGMSNHVYKLRVSAKDHGVIEQFSTEGSLEIVVNKSVSVTGASNGNLSGSNFTIVVAVACSTVIIVVILLIAIIIIRCQERRKQLHHRNHLKALHTLTVKDKNGDCCFTGGDTSSLSSSCDKNKKEVSFSMDVTDMGFDNLGHENNLQIKPLTNHDDKRHKHNKDGRSAPYKAQSQNNSAEGDNDSIGSGADSGRGESEEGERQNKLNSQNKPALHPRAGQSNKDRHKHSNGGALTPNHVAPSRSVLYSEHTAPPRPPQIENRHQRGGSLYSGSHSNLSTDTGYYSNHIKYVQGAVSNDVLV